MNKTLTFLTLSLVCTALCINCKHQEEPNEKCNAVYYWRTVLETDSIERDFLRANDVNRAYVRFFDIVVDKSPVAMDVVVPNATLQVEDSLSVKEIVPTIFITQDAIVKMKSDEDVWAGKIVKRVFNMCSYNGFAEPAELQLDCDWTESTQSVFFALCTAVKKEFEKRNQKAILSATIRLHQLQTPPPPVDSGVLMLYNTGSFKDADEPNSIISVENIKPYLKYLAGYGLPLDYAYPIFSWDLVFDSYSHFKGLINSGSVIPDDVLAPVSGNSNKYIVVKDTTICDIYLHQGDLVRKEDAPFQTIMEVKKLIDQKTRDKNRNVILYQLDKKNLTNYSSDEFKQIYK